MNYWKIDEKLPTRVDDTNRTLGVCHLSDVINSMAVDLFNVTYRGEGDEEARQLQFEKGFVWERALEKAYGEGMAMRPGEFNLDGIYCSPDGLNYSIILQTGEVLDTLVLEEYKATALSSNKTPDDSAFWKYVLQMKAYCYVTGCNHAVLRVFHVRGDYKDNTPAYNVWGFEFNERELRENWVSIVNHAKAKGWV